MAHLLPVSGTIIRCLTPVGTMKSVTFNSWQLCIHAKLTHTAGQSVVNWQCHYQVPNRIAIKLKQEIVMLAIPTIVITN